MKGEFAREDLLPTMLACLVFVVRLGRHLKAKLFKPSLTPYFSYL